MEEGPHIPVKLLPRQISKISGQKRRKTYPCDQNMPTTTYYNPGRDRGGGEEGRRRALWLRVRMLNDRIILLGLRKTISKQAQNLICGRRDSAETVPKKRIAF